MHPYFKKDTIFASDLYGIYNGSPCKSHTDRPLISYLLLKKNNIIIIIINIIIIIINITIIINIININIINIIIIIINIIIIIIDIIIIMYFTCFPIGSGLVIVVLKYPSHSNLPYRPAQWLCLLPVWGRHHGTRVLYCLSAGSHGLPSAQLQTPLRWPVELVPFFLSTWVYRLKVQPHHHRHINICVATTHLFVVQITHFYTENWGEWHHVRVRICRKRENIHYIM